MRQNQKYTIIMDQTKMMKEQKQKLKWFCYVKRMKEDKIAKLVYNAKAQGKRSSDNLQENCSKM